MRQISLTTVKHIIAFVFQLEHFQHTLRASTKVLTQGCEYLCKGDTVIFYRQNCNGYSVHTLTVVESRSLTKMDHL